MKHALFALLIVGGCAKDEDVPADTTTPDEGMAAETATPDTETDVPAPSLDSSACDQENIDGYWLVDHAAWTQVDADADPFADHRPPDAEPCNTPNGYDIVGCSFEIDTDFCGYMTATQPTVTTIPKGWIIEIIIWYLDLVPPEIDPDAAEAHLAVQLGDVVLLEETVTIPGDSDFLEATILAEAEIPEGTPFYFHVHNHGPNSYRLLRATIEPAKRIE